MKTIPELNKHALELIRRTSTMLPDEIVGVLERGTAAEEEGSAARSTLETILDNIKLAAEKSTPICQDTGTPVFYIKHPWDYPTAPIKEAITEAVREATTASYLRPNSVCSVTGKNSGDNTGPHFPSLYFEQWERPGEVRIELMLKGGGSENKSIQYSLPNGALKAGRDLEGVRRTILDGVVQAQGQGCGPAILGICIGGDRSSGYALAKKQVLRKLDDVNPDPALAKLEGEILTQANELGIGPMGFGGYTTVLGVKIAAANRVPASFFVSIVYMCWAARHRAMTIKEGEVTHD